MHHTLEDLRHVAKKAAADGKDWHFHILAPDCHLLAHDGFCTVLEIEGKEIMRAETNQRPGAIGKELAALLHKIKITQEHIVGDALDEEASAIVERAEALSKKKYLGIITCYFLHACSTKNPGNGVWCLRILKQMKHTARTPPLNRAQH